jgi:hypothetical protein
LAEERPEQQPTYNVLKTWAFDDWGLYGRGDELLARALARHPRVGRVVHVQPPIDPAELRSRFRDPRWEQDMEGQLRRLKGVEDDGVFLFAPTSQPDRREAALDATVAMLEREQAFAQPLVMLHGLAHPFASDLASRLGGRGVTRVAMVRRDARAPYPVDADERLALEEIYKVQLSGADLVWAGTRELREEFAALNPRTVLHPVGADQGLAGGEPAAELAGLPRPLIIYAGSMRAYLNVGLIRGTADRLREASFVFVGPAADFLAPLVSGLRNVHVIGPRPTWPSPPTRWPRRPGPWCPRSCSATWPPACRWSPPRWPGPRSCAGWSGSPGTPRSSPAPSMAPSSATGSGAALCARPLSPHCPGTRSPPTPWPASTPCGRVPSRRPPPS